MSDAQPVTSLAVNKGGQPSPAEQILTDEMIEAIETLLLEGNYQETVAAALGIHRRTWHRWMLRGEAEPNTIFERFCHTVKTAQAKAEILALRDIRRGLEGWQSKAWLMERRFQERWGRRLDITIRREAAQLAEQLGITVEELLADAERIVQQAQSGVEIER